MGARRSPEEEASWQAVRREVLTRDEGICQDCREYHSPRDLDVHHLIPRAAGGRDEVSNCITLCDGCHAARHPNLQVSLSRRLIERWALRIARLVDRARELPDETAALQSGLRTFGADRFRDGQLEAVLAALNGESLLVIRPTGGGKSLCFQLPALLKGQPTTFVLSPLKALMEDQYQGLQRRKIPATFINSDISRDEKEQRFELLEKGDWTLLYLAPERFNPERVNPEEIERLCARRPNYLVVDEAHLVDRWGDDFRTDYSRIADIRRKLGDPPVLAFTATASTTAQARIKESLGIPDARSLISGVDRPNIALIRLPGLADDERARVVAGLVERLGSDRAMIFVPTTNVGREVQKLLAEAGCDLPLYHAKLPKLERESLFERFTGQHEPPLNAVICTSAFSMGLDVANVRVVVNWQHPAAVEDYLQEFGRAGRDGKPALNILFTDGGKEARLLRWMAERTSEAVVAEGRRTPQEAARALQIKYERIADMGRFSRERSRCFRALINEELTGPRQVDERSLALRILESVFGSRTRVEKAEGCCDVCDPELAQRVREGTYVPSG